MPGKYADVIIPLKFKDSITYSIPESFESRIAPGSIVRVTVVGRPYTAVVIGIKDTPDLDTRKIIGISSVADMPPVTGSNMEFMRQVADYYMCSLGEVFRFAAPSTVKMLKRSGKDTGTEQGKHTGMPAAACPVLSQEQEKAAGDIKAFFSKNRNVLLHGITGSGKTEIYITLALECMEKGKNVLYLVPEIALSRQIQNRLAAHFGNRLMVYHSRQTAASKRDIYKRIAMDSEPYIVLGLRSALFLPYRNLGLVIVDEEHDASYKQTDQAPRYNGRDTALMLGRIMRCPVLLGSATPSFESIYNASTGKLGLVVLDSRYYGGEDNTVRIVDMPEERRKNAVKGPFSLILLKAIDERLKKKEQVAVFRSRRAYASAMECQECGAVPKCPRCNIPLSYHKFSSSLSCHYCGFTAPAPESCPECGKGRMLLMGDGTEKVEEVLQDFFPHAKIARLDADTARNRNEESRILRQFANGETDILVGTQMISKGFDFSGLTLTAVLKAETVTQVFDFRADERALQLMRQLLGRAGRRSTPGEMIVQTSRADHPVFRMLLHPETADNNTLLDERREFGYPPFTRIILLVAKSGDRDKAAQLADKVFNAARNAGFTDISGPAQACLNAGEYTCRTIIKASREKDWTQARKRLYNSLRDIPAANLTIDADPVNI